MLSRITEEETIFKSNLNLYQMPPLRGFFII